LARNAGYVYYESDYFRLFRNPYVPPDVDVDLTHRDKSQQNLLRGAGLTERMEVCDAAWNMASMTKDEALDEEALVKYYEFICDDIKRERERIGGDWAVALNVNTRRLRDLVRSRLGPDLTFVVLDIAWEDLEERVTSRWDETSLRIKMALSRSTYEKCDPAGGDEPSTVGIRVVPGDTPQLVVEKILDQV